MSSGHEAARVARGGRLLLHLLGLALLAALWLLISAARADADPVAPTPASQASPVGDVAASTVGPVLEAAPQPAPAGEQPAGAADAGTAVVERGGEDARSHVHRVTEAATGAVTDPVRQAADEAPALEPADRVVHHTTEHVRTVDRTVDDTVATTSGATDAAADRVAGLALSSPQSPSSSGAPVSAQRRSLQRDHHESLVLQRDSRTGAPSAEVIDTASGSFAAGVAPTEPAGHDGTPTARAAYDVRSPAGGASAGSGSSGHQASTRLLCVAPASAGVRTGSPTRAVAASDRQLPRSRTIPHGSTPD